MRKPRAKLQIVSVTIWLLAFVGAPSARAHEFWIEPASFRIEAGHELQAHLNVGQEMQGYTLLYLPDQFKRFELTVGDKTRPVSSRIGDSPALSETISEPGLLVVSYVSTDSLLTYTDPQKFQRFLDYEGLGWVRAEHERRGLPAVGFTEAFQRFAKSLVKVGDGAGTDRPLGLEFELVVETNPYLKPADEITARLLYRGKPFANAQVNIFRRRYDDVHKTHLVTDAEGRIRLATADAPGIYLLNAVHLIERPPNDQGIVWKSLWASTTFEISH